MKAHTKIKVNRPQVVERTVWQSFYIVSFNILSLLYFVFFQSNILAQRTQAINE